MNEFENPERLGRELVMAVRHIEWLITCGLGDSSDSLGIRLNAKQFIKRPIIGQILTRWPTQHLPYR